jgi:3-mercaptopyruvate sulfurtransferase SseA
MKSAGVSTVKALHGGFDAWRAAGYPIETHSGSLTTG